MSEPTDEEAAAITAALHTVLSSGGEAPAERRPLRWRWAGRWWTKPVVARRRRPW